MSAATEGGRNAEVPVFAAKGVSTGPCRSTGRYGNTCGTRLTAPSLTPSLSVAGFSAEATAVSSRSYLIISSRTGGASLAASAGRPGLAVRRRLVPIKEKGRT